MDELYLPPALYATWQDHKSRRIFPVGRLLRLPHPHSCYEFVYVHGALEAQSHGFIPFIGFGALDKVAYSRDLPPLFSNRVMRPSRPDYPAFVRRLGLEPPASPDAILARSNGPRATDSVEVFAEPELLGDGRWEAVFFVRGIRHTGRGEEVAASRGPEQRLFPMLDPQNPKNPRAVALRSDNELVGYCPDYLADELAERLADDPEARLTVLQVNPPPSPVHYRVLCSLRFRTREGEPPFRSPRLEPIAEQATSLKDRRARRVA